MAKRPLRQPERIEGAVVHFDVSTEAHPDVWATVDADDWVTINGTRWSATKRANGLYVRGRFGGRDALLHRVIAGVVVGVDVDHINGLTLDNRRQNLRACSQAENNVWGADRRRGYVLRVEGATVETAPHVVRVPLADGTIKEYAYPTRSKVGTKQVRIRKISVLG